MENNMIKNTASNETMAADNRSAVEIWRDFRQRLKQIKFKDSIRYRYSLYCIFTLEATARDYIRYCFQSVSHKRLSKDACDVYFTSIFNAATENFIFSDTAIAVKIRNMDVNTITDEEYDKIASAVMNAIEKKMCIQKDTLSTMILNNMESRFYINESATNSAKYANLNIFKQYCKKELTHMMGAGCAANLIDDMERYLRFTAFRNYNEAVRYYYDYNAGANIIVNNMLEDFFQDENYHDSATIIMLVASGQKSITDVSDADLHNVASDLYEAWNLILVKSPELL